jgi:hypothetical protein
MTEAPLGEVRVVVVGPRVQPDQDNSVGGDGGGKHCLHVGVTVARERRDGHRVVAGIFAVTGADIRVGVDPNDCEVVSIPVCEYGERCDTHRALTPERRNPRRAVLTNDCQGAGELLDHDRLGFHAVAFGQALIGHADRN